MGIIDIIKQKEQLSKDNCRRLGVVYIDERIVEKDLPALSAIMKELDFVVRAECRYERRAFELFTISRHFDICPANRKIPIYMVEVTRNDNHDITNIKFILSEGEYYGAETFNG